MAEPTELHETMADSHEKLRRGKVWCRTCGHALDVRATASLEHGWPMCCGSTMTIDPPEAWR